MTTYEMQPTLRGERITVRPLTPEDFDALYAAASDPAVWEQHPDSERYREEIFRERFFAGAIACGSAFAVVDNATGRVIGSSRFYEWDADAKEIAIGYTFIECDHWGGATNSELKALMLGHAFTVAGRVWFHVGETNTRSRRAVEKLGAVLSHSEDRELDGTPFVQLYYRLDPADYKAATGD